MFEELTDSIYYIQWIMLNLFVVFFKFNVIYICGFVSPVLVFKVVYMLD